MTKLTTDNMLQLKDFEFINGFNGRHYFSWKSGEIEICLEPCMNGYDVAIYRFGPDERIAGIIEPKKCTDFNFGDSGIVS